MVTYHDTEWGVPCQEDQKLFEYVVLDTFQAGLSWSIILKKREGFRQAFNNFNPEIVSKYTEDDVKRLMGNDAIIRNRLKILGTIANAKAYLEVRKEFGTFSQYLWQFVNNKTIQNSYEKNEHIGSTSPESDLMSQDMKKRGFKFCGSTICYAFMQGAGLVNDHLVSCFRHQEVQNIRNNN